MILLALCRPRHGYAVMQFIEEQTGGRVLLGAGTLYGALEAMSKKGWIQPVSEGAEKGGKQKKEYVITEIGRLIAEREAQRLDEVREIARRNMMEVEDIQ